MPGSWNPIEKSPGEFKKRLLRRYFVRFHMALILFSVIMSGVLASRLLHLAGMRAPIVRYPLAVCLSYCVFLALVRIWVWFVTTNRAAASHDYTRGIPDAAAELFDGDNAVDLARAAVSGTRGSSFSVPGSSIDFDLEDGWFIVAVLAVLILVIFGSGAYLIYMAPELLGEVAFQAALASALSRAARQQPADSPGWAGGLIRGTLIPFGAVLAITIVLAVAMHNQCPSATRLKEALHCAETPATMRKT